MATYGIVIGMSDIQNPLHSTYRLVLYGKKDGQMVYKREVANGEALFKALSSGELVLDNVGIESGKIVGKTGSLERFKPYGNSHPMLVISEIVADGKTIGYRLVTFDGVIKAIRLKDVIAYCERVGDKMVPIQNAMFVQNDKSGNSAHLRAFPHQRIRQEVINRNRADTAQPAKVDNKANGKQVSRLEELFSPAQIQQLKLGKAHGVDIRVFGNNKLSADQMKELRKALEVGVNAKAFADPAYSVEAMRALRINARYGVDVTYFVNPKYNAEQIYELSTGFLSGVDISSYADPSLSANDMSKKRIYLESQLWNEVKAE